MNDAVEEIADRLDDAIRAASEQLARLKRARAALDVMSPPSPERPPSRAVESSSPSSTATPMPSMGSDPVEATPIPKPPIPVAPPSDPSPPASEPIEKEPRTASSVARQIMLDGQEHTAVDVAVRAKELGMDVSSDLIYTLFSQLNSKRLLERVAPGRYKARKGS